MSLASADSKARMHMDDVSLIDEFMPRFQFSEFHQTDIKAPVSRVFEIAQSLDLSRSIVIRILMRMRGMPKSALTLAGLQESGFVLLGHRPNRELVLGVIGQFWRLKGNLLPFDAGNFKTFDQHGFAKATWNFAVFPGVRDGTRLSTETRIYCTDATSYRRFRRYWRVIAPFSALLRRVMLQIIKRDAERQ